MFRRFGNTSLTQLLWRMHWRTSYTPTPLVWRLNTALENRSRVDKKLLCILQSALENPPHPDAAALETIHFTVRPATRQHKVSQESALENPPHADATALETIDCTVRPATRQHKVSQESALENRPHAPAYN